MLGWCRLVIRAGLVPVLVSYLLIAGVLTGILELSGARITLPAAAIVGGIGWLGTFHVPLTVRGLPLSVLPGLPLLLMMVVTARRANRRLAELRIPAGQGAWRVIAVLAVSHGIFGLVAGFVTQGGEVRAVPATAFGVCALVTAVSAAVGVARQAGWWDALLFRLDEYVWPGLVAGTLGLAAVVCAGSAAVLLGLSLSFVEGREVFAAAGGDLGSGLGLFALSVGYLPNAISAAASFLAGPGIRLGGYIAGPFGVAAEPVPAVPLLTALPEQAQRWFPVCFLLPILCGLIVGWCTRGADPVPQHRIKMVAVAAGVVATGMFLAASLSGGRLGAATFDPVLLPAGTAALTWFGWIFFPAAVVTWMFGSRDAAQPPAAGVLDDLPEDMEDEEVDESEEAEEAELTAEDEEPEAEAEEDPEPELPQPATGEHDAAEVAEPVEKID
ncbi:hypothetical protein D5S17_11195 [Pseudonocardiaceae bacterium YIM PH 21723]|nr:hypothetical protein D5S17_11195 [Pseudonocardiaceae bacterium YIM PH 21723]